ncbi:substrate-binding periplasmic protein [Shewanella waksmanii]|uniref:substrate-binding periplasmic protein n=1 Tax=Shewanella waksmanii TaxID=213783 RepID=UPI0004BA95B4|nr:transporter substrate-binding domain-containing protein [Shewanella waksmanii]
MLQSVKNVVCERLFVWCSLLLFIAVPWSVQGTALKTVSNDYAPFYSQNMHLNGVVYQLATEALTQSGYQTSHQFYPFVRAAALTQNGLADGIIGLWYRQEREQWASYSEPLLSVNIVLLKRKDRNISYQQLQELSSYRIGIGRGYANPEVFKQAKLKTEAGSSDEENLKKLFLGRVDLVLISEDVAHHFVALGPIEYRQAFEVVGKPLSVELFHFGVSKHRQDHLQIVEQFNLALNNMKSSGRVGDILRLHGFEENGYWKKELARPSPD